LRDSEGIMIELSNLTYQLQRSVVIRAPRQLVFRYFTDSARWASWWGAGSTIDPHPGGRVYVRYANGVEASGEILAIDPDERISFTFGYASGKPMGPGESRVTISLRDEGPATRLTLTHDFADTDPRDQHVQGWRYQLSVFANVVADEANARAATAIDEWFNLWTDHDAASRTRTLNRLAIPDVIFHDRYSSLAGMDDLVAHIGAFQRFMPNMKIERRGDVRHCQGVVLADWSATTNGNPSGQGTNVFVFSPAGSIESVTGFWG
jgi:uncharacterized protein YndB with AHSA1/START domain